jgi:uncharacterized protein with HEPN domain
MSKVDDLTRLKPIADAVDRVRRFTEGKTSADLESDEMLTLALVRFYFLQARYHHST